MDGVTIFFLRSDGLCVIFVEDCKFFVVVVFLWLSAEDNLADAGILRKVHPSLKDC